VQQPGPEGVEGRFDHDEKRGFEGGQCGHGASKAPIGEADLKNTEIEQRDRVGEGRLWPRPHLRRAESEGEEITDQYGRHRIALLALA